jgi:hypothetical protein
MHGVCAVGSTGTTADASMTDRQRTKQRGDPVSVQPSGFLYHPAWRSPWQRIREYGA